MSSGSDSDDDGRQAEFRGRTAAVPAGATRRAISVRNSRDADVPAMLAIYLHHIRRGVEPGLDDGEFETPNAEDIKRRRKNMQKRKMPHIVAEENGVVLGYAYAVPFRKRPAYRYAVKHSIYVHTDHLQRGVGRLLMGALIDACAAAGFRQMIGYIDAANRASLGLARALRLPPGRLPALDRLQVQPLDRHGHGPALARARAGPSRRRCEGQSFRLLLPILPQQRVQRRTPTRGGGPRRHLNQLS